jgi:hypothetical protein
MAYLRAVSTGARTSKARTLLYKSDHPRRIDQYIDFFGDGGARPEVSADYCGDLLLGLLA